MDLKRKLLEETQKLLTLETVCIHEVTNRINTFDYDIFMYNKETRKCALLLLFSLYYASIYKTAKVKRTLLEVTTTNVNAPFYNKDRIMYLDINNNIDKINNFNKELNEILPTQGQCLDRSILSYVITSGNRKMMVSIDARSALKFVSDKWLEATPDPLDTVCFVSRPVKNEKLDRKSVV